ncbi:MAG: uroporphyrinogen decarboxylase [Coriobacteriia bacterium]|nr:uroporphyrinogen decarboxylase [Coriobacteriia bacterium]
MLTKRENLVETMRGGNPDRFVNQYEYMFLAGFGHPLQRNAPEQGGPGRTWRNIWGVTYAWPEGYPGGMPIHRPETIVLNDIKQWRDVLKAPNLDYPEEEYVDFINSAAACDRNEQYLAMMIAPGLFEQTHHLMGMEGALIAIAEDPDEVRAMVEWYADWEIAYAKTIIDRIHPDAMLHHDDWGSQISTFMSTAMFDQVYLPVYKRLYGWYKKNGIELIVHHSDSYAATLVPQMIEMGIDIFQGAMTTNNIPELIEHYGGQITIQGGLDNGRIDRADWTPELIDSEVRQAVADGGKHYFIPSLVAGGPGSTYPGVYDAVTEKINELSKEYF